MEEETHHPPTGGCRKVARAKERIAAASPKGGEGRHHLRREGRTPHVPKRRGERTTTQTEETEGKHTSKKEEGGSRRQHYPRADSSTHPKEKESSTHPKGRMRTAPPPTEDGTLAQEQKKVRDARETVVFSVSLALVLPRCPLPLVFSCGFLVFDRSPIDLPCL